MLGRCRNPNHWAFPDYGGRGITVCPEWESFERFSQDMGNPAASQTLDRVDNEQGYRLSNCRWATRTEQNRNTRRNVYITFGSTTLCATAWAEKLGIPVSRIYNRVRRGLAPAQVLKV